MKLLGSICDFLLLYLRSSDLNILIFICIFINFFLHLFPGILFELRHLLCSLEVKLIKLFFLVKLCQILRLVFIIVHDCFEFYSSYEPPSFSLLLQTVITLCNFTSLLVANAFTNFVNFIFWIHLWKSCKICFTCLLHWHILSTLGPIHIVIPNRNIRIRIAQKHFVKKFQECITLDPYGFFNRK